MKSALKSLSLAILLAFASAFAQVSATKVETVPPSTVRALLPDLPDETPLRRFDLVFFISLPFTLLYGGLLDTALSGAMSLRGLADRTGGLADFGAFTYPDRMISGTFLFIALNSILWSGAVAFNDLHEKRHAASLGSLRRAYARDADSLWLFRTRF